MQRENEAIQKIYWLADLVAPGLHPTLSPALALAIGRKQGVEAQHRNPLRLGDRRPGL